MRYKKEIYKKAKKILYERRKDAQDSLEFRRKSLYKIAPEAKEFEKELANTSINVARAVLKGANTANELKILKENNLKIRDRLENVLKKFNLPKDYLKIKYTCEKCNDTGFISGTLCECIKKIMKKEVYDELNKLSPLKLSTFKTFSLSYYSNSPIHEGEQSPREIMTFIYEFCIKYAREFNKNSQNLIMRGGTGLGKTHLSLAIANTVIENGFGVIYISAPNMVSKLEKEKFGSSETLTGSEEYFINCDLLIIDDLGTEFSTQFSNSTIYNIVNSRILMSKPTIISTNLSIKELEKNYTERMVSRIIGENVRLEFIGEDIRQKKRLKNLENCH